MADINVGKFINNLDKEDLSSEDLQGVVNNVYAKAISDHKKLKKAAEDNTKEQDKETATFVKANHDRLKAHKNKPEKDIDKDDATAKDKVAKEVNESFASEIERLHNDDYVWNKHNTDFEWLYKELNIKDDEEFDIKKAVEKLPKAKQKEIYLRMLEPVVGEKLVESKKLRKGRKLKEANGSYTLNTGKRKSQKGKFNDSTTFEQWYNATFDSPSYRNSEYYPFNNYVKIFSSAESLRNATADDIVKNAHRFYDVYDVDSADREYAFNFARDVTGIDYEDFYNAWSSGEPLAESKKLKESEDEFEVAKYKGNQYGIWSKSSKNWMTFGKKADLEKRVKELNAKKSCKECTKESLRKSGKRLKESAEDKVVIYKEFGKYRATPESNYNSRVQNERGIQKLDAFNSADEIINYYIKYGWAKSPDEFIVKESKDIKGKKRLTEAEDGNITIETSTSILDLFYPSLYQTIDDYYIPDGEWGRVDDILAITSMDFAEDAIKEVFPSATLKFKELRHPREYNFGGENIIFDVTLPRADYERVKQEVAENPEFAQFLKKNSPRDGYIPFGAYTVDKFKTQDDMYSLGQIVKFFADNEDLQYDFDDKFREEIGSNFETYDYLWEEVMDWLKEHDQAYQDFLTHFNADEGSVIDLDSIIGWISEHDTLAQDFENYFGFSINESLVENYKGADAIEPGDFYKVAIKELPAEDIDHHESDLYIRKTPKSTELIKKLTTDSLLSTFKDQIDNDIWYELPFCYSPFWQSKNNIKEGRSIKESLKESVRYKDTRKQAAYENACDCIIYGYGKSYWNSLDLNDEEKKEVWKQAYNDLAETESLPKRRLRKLKEGESSTIDSYEKGNFKAYYGKEPGAKDKPYWSNMNLFSGDEVIGSFGYSTFRDEESAKKDFEKKKKFIDRKLKEAKGSLNRFEPKELDKIFQVGAKFKLKKPMAVERYIPDNFGWDFEDDEETITQDSLDQAEKWFRDELKDSEQYSQEIIDKYIVVDPHDGIKLELPAGFELQVAEKSPNAEAFDGNPWFTEVAFDTKDGQIKMLYNSLPGPTFIARNSQRS